MGIKYPECLADNPDTSRFYAEYGSKLYLPDKSSVFSQINPSSTYNRVNQRKRFCREISDY